MLQGYEYKLTEPLLMHHFQNRINTFMLKAMHGEVQTDITSRYEFIHELESSMTITNKDICWVAEALMNSQSFL